MSSIGIALCGLIDLNKNCYYPINLGFHPFVNNGFPMELGTGVF